MYTYKCGPRPHDIVHLARKIIIVKICFLRVLGISNGEYWKSVREQGTCEEYNYHLR